MRLDYDDTKDDDVEEQDEVDTDSEEQEDDEEESDVSNGNLDPNLKMMLQRLVVALKEEGQLEESENTEGDAIQYLIMKECENRGIVGREIVSRLAERIFEYLDALVNDMLEGVIDEDYVSSNDDEELTEQFIEDISNTFTEFIANKVREKDIAFEQL